MARRRHLSVEKKKLDEVSDKLEARLVRAILKAFDRMREDFSVEIAEEVIALGDKRRAGTALTTRQVENRLEPSAKIVEDTHAVGGKLGAEAVNNAS